jgi:hypothetical protein
MGLMGVMCRRRVFCVAKSSQRAARSVVFLREADFRGRNRWSVKFVQSVRAVYVQFALAVVGVDGSTGGDEEVISTWQVRLNG